MHTLSGCWHSTCICTVYSTSHKLICSTIKRTRAICTSRFGTNTVMQKNDPRPAPYLHLDRDASYKACLSRRTLEITNLANKIRLPMARRGAQTFHIWESQIYCFTHSTTSIAPALETSSEDHFTASRVESLVLFLAPKDCIDLQQPASFLHPCLSFQTLVE